ncbi:hypothetical protein CYMTET_2824 [Cymbomonas tetramitiformis]|uniref:WAT1-related protein n=1 Tax=Cymbomonas tetramitiformis TaxID=36881 RepID=A0AAE0LLP5_9CHLO|nr:hypothetical protein CYMTET_2824 [Cymbomonas tetramitiformis]
MQDFFTCAAVLIFAQTGYAGSAVVAQVFASGSVDPFVLSWIRDTLAVPFMLALSIWVEGVHPPSRKELWKFALVGGVGIYAAQLMYILGLFLTNASVASLLSPTMPVMCSILAVITGQEDLPRLSRLHGCLKSGGILLACCGAIMIVALGKSKSKGSDDDDDESSNARFIAGELLILGNCAASALYLVLQKILFFGRAGQKSELDAPNSLTAAGIAWRELPFTIIAYCYVVGAGFMTLTTMFLACVSPTYVPKDTHEHVSRFDVPAKAWIVLVYMVLVTSVFCYCAATWANKRLPASVVTAFWPCQAMAGVLLSVVFLGAIPNLFDLLGGLAIILGLLAVCSGNHLLDAEERMLCKNDSDLQVGPDINTSLLGCLPEQKT